MKVYTPPRSATGFLLSEHMISLIVGPVGSTKTTAAIMKIAYHAKRMAPCTDGIRRSRCIWVRNTREQLMDTSIPDFLKWFPDGVAGTYEKTNRRFVLRLGDVECEVLFRGLDDANDVRRVLSLQTSFAVLDEFREIDPAVFEALQGRLGRYPDKSMVPPRPEWGLDDKGNEIGGCVTDDGADNRHLWGATNPPDMDTFWEQYLTEPPATAGVYFQPSGMSPDADWLKYLPSNYYENLAEGKKKEWVDVYIHAKFGRSLAGQPVHPDFRSDFHIAKNPLQPIKMGNYPLIIGMDFGLSPAVTVNQQDPRGRLLTLAEATSENMGALRFVREKLRPLLSQRFPGHPVLIIGDPAGRIRAQTDEATVFQLLQREGFSVQPASTNVPNPRISAVDGFLTRQVDGGAGWLIDPSCTMLIAALRGKYRYKARKDGSYEPSPEKNQWSHVADAQQYACLYYSGDQLGLAKPQSQRRDVRPASMRAFV